MRRLERSIGKCCACVCLSYCCCEITCGCMRLKMARWGCCSHGTLVLEPKLTNLIMYQAEHPYRQPHQQFTFSKQLLCRRIKIRGRMGWKESPCSCHGTIVSRGIRKTRGRLRWNRDGCMSCSLSMFSSGQTAPNCPHTEWDTNGVEQAWCRTHTE